MGLTMVIVIAFVAGGPTADRPREGLPVEAPRVAVARSPLVMALRRLRIAATLFTTRRRSTRIPYRLKYARPAGSHAYIERVEPAYTAGMYSNGRAGRRSGLLVATAQSHQHRAFTPFPGLRSLRHGDAHSDATSRETGQLDHVGYGTSATRAKCQPGSGCPDSCTPTTCRRSPQRFREK